MKKSIWIVLYVLCQVALSQNDQRILIAGTIRGDSKGYNKIYSYGNDVPDGLVQELNNNSFEFSIPFKKPVYVFFYTEYDLKTKGGYQPFGVLVDQPGKVTIHVNDISNGFKDATVTGISTSVLYQSLRSEEKNINSRIFQITERKYGKGWVPGKDPLYPRIGNYRDSLIKVELYPFVKKWIIENVNSYASVFVLNEYKESFDFDSLVKTFGLLKRELQGSEHGTLISYYIEGIKNAQIGKIAQDFNLPTNEGTPFSLSQVGGKYIVLDFWASWCGPCRESFPHMREVYSRLKGRNIEFVNISIDKNKDYWTKAVQQENNPWIQVWDNQEVALKSFGVTTIPTTFLISSEGKILVKEIGFNPSQGQIETKLKELFGI